jgi:hypothetical protein
MRAAPRFTQKQGRYLAFIYVYAHMFREPKPNATAFPRQSALGPSLCLERDGLISREAGIARSIAIVVPPHELPILQWLQINPSKPL